MTVFQLEHTMSVKELMAWSVYFKDESPDVNEIQMAVLSNMVVSYMGKKNSKYTDFLIRKQATAKTDDKPISNDAILSIFQSMGAK